jgi:hypothetical protein
MEGVQAMARPSKSASVIAEEKKSHRTKAEIKQREDAEKALITGVALCERPEVEESQAAHAEFIRIEALLKVIGKNDAIYEAAINRYCSLQAECGELEDMRKDFRASRAELKAEYQAGKICDEDKGGLTASQYYKLLSAMQKNYIDADKQIQIKRKMMFDIERENGMTIAAALRSIPKNVNKAEDPLKAALADDTE